jgi:hypothetical protein
MAKSKAESAKRELKGTKPQKKQTGMLQSYTITLAISEVSQTLPFTLCSLPFAMPASRSLSSVNNPG